MSHAHTHHHKHRSAALTQNTDPLAGFAVSPAFRAVYASASLERRAALIAFSGDFRRVGGLLDYELVRARH